METQMPEPYALLSASLYALECEVEALKEEIAELRERLAEMESDGWLGGTD